MLKRRNFVKMSLFSLASIPLLGTKITFASNKDQHPMRRIGLIGGTSWHSTIDYYRYINQMVNDREGDRVNPPLLLLNLNQKQINDLQDNGSWDDITDIYVNSGKDLIAGGAKALVLCANTAHAMYDKISSQLSVPVLHIADATAKEAASKGLKTLGLFGTKYTMEKEYIKSRLTDKFGLKVLVPDQEARTELQRIIRDELSIGVLKEESKQYLISEMDKLKKQGAEGIILGCTEFPLLVKQPDYGLPLLDTTYLHSKMAVDFIFENN